MHHRLRLCGGARLHDAQQEAHEHGLHQVHLALHQGRVPVRWQPPAPLRAPLPWHMAKATDGFLVPVKQPQVMDEPFWGLMETQEILLPNNPSGALHMPFPWPVMSPPLDLLSRKPPDTLSWKCLLLTQ